MCARDARPSQSRICNNIQLRAHSVLVIRLVTCVTVKVIQRIDHGIFFIDTDAVQTLIAVLAPLIAAVGTKNGHIKQILGRVWVRLCARIRLRWSDPFWSVRLPHKCVRFIWWARMGLDDCVRTCVCGYERLGCVGAVLSIVVLIYSIRLERYVANRSD